MRKIVTEIFNDWVRLSTIPATIAVVGGDSTDPELALLSQSEMTFFGIENIANDVRFRQLDLNSDLSDFVPANRFDLVLCSQVVEHLYNLPQSIKVISSLVKPGGICGWAFLPQISHMAALSTTRPVTQLKQQLSYCPQNLKLC